MASNTVILGAGIIGCSTAYYLSLSSHTAAQTIHLVESSPKLFASASGYAAGFLAKDWFSPPVAALGALSFDLHKELAEKHNGRENWGYSRSTGTSTVDENFGHANNGERGDAWLREGGSRTEMAGVHKLKDGVGPAWLTRRKGTRVEVISEDDTVAQVDPLRLSQFLLNQSLERGVRLHQPARAVSVSKDMRDELAAIRIAKDDGEELDLPCTRLIITAGAWTPQVFATLFPSARTRIPISSLAGHSLVLQSPRWSAEHESKGCHAVFATDSSGFSPEVFSRIGGEIYVAGLNDAALPLPQNATDASPNEESIARLQAVAQKMLARETGEDDLQVSALCR